MTTDKVYYNTEYRKQIKALSKFNIFIKDRISKKDEIQEIKLKKKVNLVVPLVYKNLFRIYRLIKKLYNRWIYKQYYNIKLSLDFYESLYIFEKDNIFMYLKNQLVLEYFFNGIIYFFLIVNWLWTNEWNKWASLTNIIEYSFFDIIGIFRYISNYFIEFNDSIIKSYNELLLSINFSVDYNYNIVNLYNLFLFNSLDLFYFLFNVEKIKLEHEKNFVKKKDWKKIRRVVFNYFNLNLLNDCFNLSFFSFVIYEFFLLFQKYNLHYITINFFEYWINFILEKNVKKYFNSNINKKEFKFNSFNLKKLSIKIKKTNFFTIRVNYNLFLSNIDYFLFLKELTYNYYIRNCEYFIEFASHRKIFLRYNNPSSVNKGSLGTYVYDQLFKRFLLASNNNINSNYDLFNIERFEPYFNFYNKQAVAAKDFILESMFKDYNIRFLYKLRTSNHFYFSINKFFYFNLIDFYNLKNKLESYKDVMAIDSVYEYRFANSSFKTMEEFMLAIFKTPLENYYYFNEFYKNTSYNIIYNIFMRNQKDFFFKDFVNIYNNKFLKIYTFFLRAFSRLYKLRTYFFKFNYLWKLMRHEDAEKILKIDIYSNFFDYFERKKMFIMMQKFKRMHFYRRWYIKKFYNIIKYNTMFYLDIYSIKILFNGWLYETMFFSWYLTIVNIYNKLLSIFDLFNYYRYLIGFKDFYFQLVHENLDYVLIFIFIFFKEIRKNSKFNYINKSNLIYNNFVYRKYMSYTWLEYNYYDDLFDDLDTFTKEVYSDKLSQWILRYFYNKAESHLFYSESIINRYINKKRLLL